MRNRFSFPFFAAALILSTAPVFCAQVKPQPSNTSRIAAIAISGTKKYSDEQFYAASGLKPGDTVTTEQIKAAAERLAALGLFTTANYRYTPKGTAINLEFQVEEAPTAPLLFDNFPWFSDDEMLTAVRHGVDIFAGEAPESGALLDQITDVIDKLLVPLKVKGAVSHELVRAPSGDGMVMEYRIDAPGLRVQSVEFGDPIATASERLKDRVSDIVGQPYSRFAIEVFGYEQVRPLYLSPGYLRVKIGLAQTHLVINLQNPIESAVDVTIPISLGPVYAFGGVAWRGNTVLPTQSLDGVVGIELGAAADGMKTETAWQRVATEYGRHGYLDTKVEAQSKFDDNQHRVSYEVAITEGSQYRMGELIITGLSLEAEAQLKHVWQLAPGQVFDGDYFDRLLPVLAKPSADVFGTLPVHYSEFGHLLRPNTEHHTVDVLMDFK